MLSRLISAAWLFVCLPDALPDCLPDALPTPALVRATAGQSFVPIGGDARSVPPQSSGVGSAAGMAVTTPACSPGSHLGKPPQTADAGVLTTEPPKGRWETRTVNCGPFGQQRSSGRFTKEIQVWVDGPLEKTKRQPASDEGVRRAALPTARLITGDGLLPAVASSCPGGVCPGHR